MNSPSEIASRLYDLANLLEISGENDFKVRAHRVAAETVSFYMGTTDELLAAIDGDGIKGLGAQLGLKVKKLAETLDLTKVEGGPLAVPESLLAILSLPGVGPKKVKALYGELGVKTLEDLEINCAEGKVAELKGFSDKMVEKILTGIALYRKRSKQCLISTAAQLKTEVLNYIREKIPGISVEPTCTLRRQCEIVDELVFIAKNGRLEQAGEALLSQGLILSYQVSGAELGALLKKNKLPLRIILASDESFAKIQFENTGSKLHVDTIQSRIPDFENLSFKTEHEIYSAAKLPFVLPERREDEFVGSIENETEALVEIADLKGIVHCHTTYSDGRNSLREMAVAAKELGYEYIGITDHSISAAYAGGLTLDKINAQHKEIESLNVELAPFRIFKGIESDIKSEGELDYPAQILERFDFVIASVHSGFGIPKDQMTARIIRAVENPYTTMLGHSTGRLLLEREGYDVDLEAVIRAAAAKKVIIELNSNPHRLDMDWRWWELAKSLGVRTSINPDAHSIKGFADVQFGIAMARKAGLQKAEVVNCLSLQEFEVFFDRNK